jgi:ATP-dependent 26S proteasome regulatory subunit
VFIFYLQKRLRATTVQSQPPDQFEPALASRPGRIDQAIEFPLPDE